MSNVNDIKAKANSLINGETADNIDTLLTSNENETVTEIEEPYQINCYTLSGVYRSFNTNLNGHCAILSEQIGNAIKLLFKYGEQYGSRMLTGTVVIEVVEDGDYDEIYSKDELTTLLTNVFRCGVGKVAVYKFIKVGDVTFRFNCETRHIMYLETYEYMASVTASIIFRMFNNDLTVNEDIKHFEEKARLRKKEFYELNGRTTNPDDNEETFKWKLEKMRYHYDVAKNFDDVM